MMKQAELDAQQINDLRNKISITGNTTLNKMYEIVAKNPIDDQGAGRAQTAASVTASRKSKEAIEQ